MIDISCCLVIPVKIHCCSSARKRVSPVDMKKSTKDALHIFLSGGIPIGALPDFSQRPDPTMLQTVLGQHTPCPFPSGEKTVPTHYIYWIGLFFFFKGINLTEGHRDIIKESKNVSQRWRFRITSLVLLRFLGWWKWFIFWPLICQTHLGSVWIGIIVCNTLWMIGAAN